MVSLRLSQFLIYLTHKHQQIHGCVLSTVATDGLVLKHQAISIHSVEIFIVFEKKCYIYSNEHDKVKINFENRDPVASGLKSMGSCKKDVTPLLTLWS